MVLLASSNLNPTSPSRSSRRTVLGPALGSFAGFAAIGSATAKPTRDAKRGGPTGAAARRGQRRRPRFKVVTRTFRNTSPIIITDESPAVPYPSVTTVSGLKGGRLLDLNVTLLGFNHDYPRDVDLLLVAPNGRSAVILSDVGGGNEVSNLTVVLDDQASAPPTVLDPLVSGRFQPRNEAVPDEETDSFRAPAAFSPHVRLATFNGVNPNGTWKLYLVDDASSDTGSITGGWTLTIKARVRA